MCLFWIKSKKPTVKPTFSQAKTCTKNRIFQVLLVFLMLSYLTTSNLETTKHKVFFTYSNTVTILLCIHQLQVCNTLTFSQRITCQTISRKSVVIATVFTPTWLFSTVTVCFHCPSTEHNKTSSLVLYLWKVIILSSESRLYSSDNGL